MDDFYAARSGPIPPLPWPTIPPPFSNAAIPPTNDRMPVLLEPHQYDQWLHGKAQDVIRFQFGDTIAADRMEIERTDDRWRSAGKPRAADKQFAFL